MKTIKVKGLWQGKVALRDKYLNWNDDFCFVRADNGEKMTIGRAELRQRIVGKSDRPFFDKFSDAYHYLYYFDWKPDPVKEATLF